MNVNDAVNKLRMLRDEVKLHIHLATLDAKKEWDEKLEPRLHEIEQTGKSVADAPRDLVEKVEEFVMRLRANHDAPASKA